MTDTAIISSIVVRKAVCDDINGIMDVACSEGRADKNHRAGFLMDDYNANPDFFRKKFLSLIDSLKYFYVIENGAVLGFTIAYTKEEWLQYNPNWLEDIIWSPDFDLSKTEKFLLVDKTAILRGLTGKGLGSRIYDTLICNVRDEGINDLFAETIISPVPNFASLEFRLKQKYTLAGVRYEKHNGQLYTDLVYHKQL